MFKEFGKWLRMVGYFFSSVLGKKSDKLAKNPDVIKKRYDAVIDEKRKRINQYKEAIAQIKTGETEKKLLKRRLEDEVAKLEKLKAGAIEATRKVLEKHNQDIVAAKQDIDYVKWHGAFRDYDNTLKEKKDRITQVEADIKKDTAQLAQHMASIQTMTREFETLRDKQRNTVAKVISAKQEQEIADMLSGISEDHTAQELQELEDIGNNAEANAEVSRSMAGLERQNEEEELLAYANQVEADDEFEALLGIHSQKESPTTEPVVSLQEKLPE